MKQSGFSRKFILIGLFLVLGCSSDNGESVVIPLPPSDLVAAAASKSEIDLQWTDNSTNEDGFKIERKTSSGNYSLIATVGSDLSLYKDLGLSPDTYLYRVYSFNSAGKSLTYSNEVSCSTKRTPELTTNDITSITSNSAISGGTISFDGGTSITERGIVWSVSPGPNKETSTSVSSGTGIGAFTSSLSNLSSNTKYYVRSYAINSFGTSYGNEINFTTSINIKDVQLEKLSKTWKLNTVTLDGIDKKSDYTNFQLILSGTKGNTTFGYSTSGRPALSPWKSSGSWEFGVSPETQMIRDKATADELTMTYAVTETTLSITFTFNGSGFSRTGSVKGQWIYTFKL